MNLLDIKSCVTSDVQFCSKNHYVKVMLDFAAQCDILVLRESHHTCTVKRILRQTVVWQRHKSWGEGFLDCLTLCLVVEASESS